MNEDHVPERIWIDTSNGMRVGQGAYDQPNPFGKSVEYARVHAPTGNEMTVESALAELREVFPYPHDLRVSISDYGGAIRYEMYRDARLIGRSRTLPDCMAQVRKWRESQ